jgi:Peptidase C26
VPGRMRWLLIQSTLLTILCSAARPQFSKDDDLTTPDSYLDVPTPAPVIGVLTQPLHREGVEMLYIAASYVKWVEAGGAQVVPVFSDRSEEELTLIFSKLNGLLVPGVLTATECGRCQESDAACAAFMQMAFVQVAPIAFFSLLLLCSPSCVLLRSTHRLCGSESTGSERRNHMLSSPSSSERQRLP